MKQKNGTDFLAAGVDCPDGRQLKPIGAKYLFRDIPGESQSIIYNDIPGVISSLLMCRFLCQLEQRSGSFVQTSRDVIPGGDAVIRSFMNSYQLTCAHHCISRSQCYSFIYYVMTRTCVLYRLSERHVINSDRNSYLYVKVM